MLHRVNGSIYCFLTEDNGCVSEAELDGLLRTILIAYDRGVIEFSNKSSASNWDLASSLFFSITVVTTIGMGTFIPEQ